MRSQDPFRMTKKDNEDYEIINPSVYLDELPHPFNFIDKCLTQQILAPVFERVVRIEESKKSVDYEGSLKEVQISGSMDIEGITTVCVDCNQNNRALIGDKFGNIHLIDASRKVLLDKKEISPKHRILNISTSTIKWVDTFLTTLAVISQRSGSVQIYCFKHNENKFYHFYSLKITSNETNDDSSYLDFPFETKISEHSNFMSITTYGGRIFAIRLPEAFDPIKKSKKVPVEEQKSTQLPLPGATEEKLFDFSSLNSDFDEWEVKEIDLETSKFLDIDPLKQQENFKDPYNEIKEETPVVEEAEDEEQKPIDENLDIELLHTFGELKEDPEEGDMSQILRTNKVFPQAHFTSSLVISKLDRTGKSLAKVMVTTGIVVAFIGQKIITYYQIQKALPKNIPRDFSSEYYQKLFIQQKNAAKNNVSKIFNEIVKNDPEQVQQTNEQISNKPVNTFQIPFYITTTAYKNQNQDSQYLAVGMLDGSVIVIDLVLGMEKFFLPNHPGEVTSLAFLDDKVLMSGCSKGRVHLYDLEDDGRMRLNVCNSMDYTNPIIKLCTTPIGIGLAVDSIGNCRLYDLMRFRKMARVNTTGKQFFAGMKEEQINASWRFFPTVCLSSCQDQIFGILRSEDVNEPEEQEKLVLNERLLMEKLLKEGKNLNGFDLRFKEEPFYTNKGSLVIMKIEEMIISLHPTIAQVKRKGLTTKEAFLQFEPSTDIPPQVSPGGPPHGVDSHYKSTLESRKSLMKSVNSSHSKKSQDNISFEFNDGEGGVKSNERGKRKGTNLSFSSKQQDISQNDEGKKYNAPTLQILHPELYKQNQKSKQTVQDPSYQAVQNIKERYQYHEMRQQRIQKRNDEISKELETKQAEEMARKKRLARTMR